MGEGSDGEEHPQEMGQHVQKACGRRGHVRKLMWLGHRDDMK